MRGPDIGARRAMAGRLACGGMTKFGVFAVAVFAALVALIVASSVPWPTVEHPPPPRDAVVVVVDAGHGGHDPGAVVQGVLEKDIALDITLRVFALAELHPRLHIVLTRSTDRYVELEDRVKLAEEVGAALYLSIHANANRSTSICGVETWVHTDVSRGDPSWGLAAVMQRAVVRATGAADRGVLQQPLYLRHTHLPAALVEVGYMTCPQELSLLQERAYQERIAQGVFQGILDFVGL